MKKSSFIVRSLEKAIVKIAFPLFYKFYTKFFRQRKFFNIYIQKIIIDEFHKLYYYSSDKTWNNTFWLNVPALKCPLDLWIYQETIFELRPDIIIESGTAGGGSALFLASICDLINQGRVITIDINQEENRPQHKRITYILGSSISDEVISTVRAAIKEKDKVLVILDSDHTKDHVLKELKLYSEFVDKGSYIIVEDTNLHGNPVVPNMGGGPIEAVREFLYENKNFIIDKSKEKFYLTFFPEGYLKRI